MKKISLLFLTGLLTINVYAAEKARNVVGVYDIVTQDNKWKLDVSLSYTTLSTDLISGVDCVSIDVDGVFDNTAFSAVPVCLADVISVSTREINTDQFLLSTNLRYRINKKLQVFTFFSGNYTLTRDTSSSSLLVGDDFTGDDGADYNSFGVGFSYEVKQETTTPAFIISSSLPLISNNQSPTGKDFNSSVSRIKVSGTMITTVDPLVFTLNASYTFRREISGDEGYKIDPGEIFTLEPVMYFAVNPYTTLNFGYRFTYVDDTKLGFKAGSVFGEQLPFQKTNQGTSSGTFRFGVQYEIARNYVMSVDIQNSNSSSTSSSSITAGLTIDF